MAMTMTGEVDLPASRAVVWEKLNDPAVLKDCIPGCESLERQGDGFVATAKVKVGPVAATFKGNVALLDLDPPNGYRIEGSGEGGIAGFAKGGAVVKLQEIDPANTRLVYNVEAQVGGKIAQLGARLIDGVAKKMADQFFESFAQAVKSAAPAAAAAAVASAAPAQARPLPQLRAVTINFPPGWESGG
ncbi:MAG: carbon monoxide dehydrogenase subunit G [Hyphomicrobiales bacterium]|nr:carbon monoxide dehydrogenase subunit G [Hyphomicrobiales bacterium]